MSHILDTHLTYGFINQTFGPEGAAELSRRLLGDRASHGLSPIFAQGGVDMSIRLDARYCPKYIGSSHAHDALLWDYLPNTGAYGRVVQQSLYMPRPDGTAAQREPHYRNLSMPIFFLRSQDTQYMHVGINLASAAQGNTDILLGVNDTLAQFSSIQKTTLVLAPKDFIMYEDQLCLWDKRAGENGTTLGRFVKKVAAWVCRAFERLRIDVHPSQVWLVGLVPVCTGHWQVILQVHDQALAVPPVYRA
ncbi:unnamed protein product [Peniophora sp. CBMAI 1063]|nr:unnamed protein product [Peniophora sp. CBMAI 1063]